MSQFRMWSALALAAGLFLASGGTSAQPPRFIPLPKQPRFVQQPPAQPKVWVPPAELPVIPKTAGAFLTLKVSEVMDHPDLKLVLEQLKKTPELFEGVTELFGVLPNEIDRVTLFWPAISDRGPGEPVVVLTMREPYNEARILRVLRAEPVYEDGRRGGRGGFDDEFRPAGGASGSGTKSAEPTNKSAPTKEIPREPKPSEAKPAEKKEGPEADASVFIAAAAPADPLFYGLRNGPFEMLFLVDEHTLVFLPGGQRGEFTVVALLAQMMQKKQTGPLAEAIAAAGNHTLAGGIYLPPLFREFDRRLPPEMAPYAALTAARIATITGDLGKSAKFNLKLSFHDAAAARRAAPVLEEGLKTIAEKLTEHTVEMRDSRQKALVPLVEAGVAGLKKAAVKADGSTVIATTEIDAGPAAAKAVAELLQSLSSRKKYMLRSNNLKQIGLALHMYFDTYGKLPTNVYGPKGELLLSWRVKLLPYLEEANLYQQFKMDEAWDSPNNKKLIEMMPKTFAVSGRDAPKGQTFYQAFLTPDPNKPLPKGANPFLGRTWLIENDKMGQSLLVPDGTSNTIGVVEARTSVIWSKPDDLLFGETIPPLGEEKADVFMVLMLDGSVRTIST
jgi:Protein of unknown function (DUF1559)